MNGSEAAQQYCVTDCSLIDLETCRPVNRRDLLSSLEEEKIQNEMYDQDGCYNSSLFQSSQDYGVYETFSLTVSILTVITGIPGLIGNVFAIIVLVRKDMKNCFNHILVALNICDSLHILFAIFDAVRNSFVSYYPQTLLLIFPYFHYPFYRISLCGSIYLIISVAIERYLAVCRPHHYRAVQSQDSRAAIYILPSLLLALLVNTTRFLETETGTICVDFSACQCSDGAFNLVFVKPTGLRLNRHYIIYYGTWGWVILTGLLPFLLLIFLNSRIYLSLQEIRKRINKSQTIRLQSQRQGKEGGLQVPGNPTATSTVQVAASTSQLQIATTDAQQEMNMNGCSPVSEINNGHVAERENVPNHSRSAVVPLAINQGSTRACVRNASPETLRQRRTNQQNRECNLAVVLLSSVLMFFVCHLPRLLTSVYEAVMIHSILYCREKGKDLTPLWFLYLMSLVQYLQVVNASVNLPIYLFASKPFCTAAGGVIRSLFTMCRGCTKYLPSFIKTQDQGLIVPGTEAEQLTLQPLTQSLRSFRLEENRDDC